MAADRRYQPPQYDPHSIEAAIARIDENVRLLRESHEHSTRDLFAKLTEAEKRMGKTENAVTFMRGNAFAISALASTIISLIAIFWKH